MNRAPLFAAGVLAIVAGSGTPVYPLRAPVSADLAGLDALTHRPLLYMTAGPGGYGSDDPCDTALFALYEDGLVIYTTIKDRCPTLSAHLAPARARALAALRMMTEFDASGAAPWRSTEFAVELWRGAAWPESFSAVPWPGELPPPEVHGDWMYSVTNYDAQLLDAAKRPFVGDRPAFVSLGERSWRYGLRSDVVPEWSYLAKVDYALSRAANGLRAP